MLPRILEPELMNTPEDASEYDAMDHTAVNAQFATDLLAALTDWSLGAWGRATASPQSQAINILDLGAGTAQIPIELANRAPNIHITAIDAAESMLVIARKNVDIAGLTNRITLVVADAKDLRNPTVSRDAEARRSGARFDSGAFPIVISNSILHHIAVPKTVLVEAIRVTAPGGLQFHRDLARPNDESRLKHVVETYAGGATRYQRKLFADSLRAALTLDEMRDLIARIGFARSSVQMTSDRHWTWSDARM